MKLKTELQKFIISFLITNIMLLYYTSSQFRNSIWEALIRTVFDFFKDYHTFLFGLAFYISTYVIFNLAYLSIHLCSRLFKIQHNRFKVTTYVIVIICFLYIVNDQLIFYCINEYKFVRYYTPLTEEKVNVDSTNYYKYDWSRKAIIEMLIPPETREEKIIFKRDSTFTLIGKRKVLDKFYLFREIFGIENEYKITHKYIYKNYFIFDSLDSYYAVKIRDQKLYINFSDLEPYN